MERVVIKVEVYPHEDMGLDTPYDVLALVEEAVRDSGLDNGARVEFSLEEDG